MKPDPHAYPPRGMSREEAARYVGVSPVKFDDMVKDHKMPLPKREGGRMIWDRHQLDACFDEIGTVGNPFEVALANAREKKVKTDRLKKAPA